MPQTLDLHARDITGLAKRQRRRRTLYLILGVTLLTLILVWITI